MTSSKKDSSSLYYLQICSLVCGCSDVGAVPRILKIKHVKSCSPRVSQLEGLVRHHHPQHIRKASITEHLGRRSRVKPTADVVCQVVLLGPNLSDHWDELVGD